MPKHLTKLSKFGGQFRLTIPRALIEEMKWFDVEFVIMQPAGLNHITVRRFIDGKSLGPKLETGTPKSR